MTRQPTDAAVAVPDEDEVRIQVENVGGIGACDVSFSSGVTILIGQNATNRTSLLKAISGALGGTAPTLKSDADSGRVALTIDGETYARTYERSGSSVRMDGTPYTEDSTLVDLFACLIAENPARQAVERGDDLREVIMRPVDSAAIEREIRDLERRRDSIDDEISGLSHDMKRLPELEEKRASIREEIDEVEGRIEDLQEAVEEYDEDAVTSELEGLMDDLEAERNRLEETLDRIDHQKTEIEALREERAELQDELDSLVEPDVDEAKLRQRMENLRDQKRRIDGEITDLSRIVEFNADLLDNDGSPVDDATVDDVSAELDPQSKTIECWTCGSEVDRITVSDRLETLQDVIAEKREQRTRIESDLENLQDERDDVERIEQREREFRRRLDEVDRQIDHRDEKVTELSDEAEAIREAIADLETQVEEAKDLRNEEAASVFEDLSDLRYRRGKLDSKLESVEAEIEEIESKSGTIDSLEAEREEVADELESLRGRIESLERSAVEAFNEHMAAVLDNLEYDNIERIWIERKTGTGRNESTFDLHTVRESDDGAVYEDTTDNLSESEREVIGIVVGLAGYLVHDVHKTVPFMLLDSLEPIDTDRLNALVEYLSEYTPYMVVALLPEAERELPDDLVRVQADELSA
jgi:DNA repair exonuclease SbcCD ATPase subunit